MKTECAHSEGTRNVTLCKYFLNKGCLTTVKNKLYKNKKVTFLTVVKLPLFILQHNGMQGVKKYFLTC